MKSKVHATPLFPVVDDVLKKSHVLEGERLTVQIYFENLGRTQGDGSEPRLKIPDDIIVDDIEDKIVEFIKKSDDCKEAIKKQLEGCYANVLWPEKGSSFIIQCTVTVSMPDFRKLVKDWKIKVEQNLKDYINQLSLKEFPVWDEGWDQVLKALNEINIENPNAVALYVEQKEKVIKVVGYRHTVEAVSIMIEKVIKTTGEEIERQKQTVKQTISNLKPLQLRMLLASKYPGKMEDQFPGLKVKINQNRNEVIFEGIYAEVQSAKVKMYEQTNTFSVRVLENISKNCIDVFQSKQVREYMVKKLKTNKLVGVWEAMNAKLAICSFESDLPLCVEFLSESVQEKIISVQKESSTILGSSQWQDKIKEMHDKDKGVSKICISEDFSKVHVTATDDIVDELTEAVKKFLKQQTVLKETVTLGNRSILRLIQNHHNSKLGDIAKELIQHYVQIYCDTGGISIQGTEMGIQLAKDKLQKLAAQLQTKKHVIKRPGLASHMSSDKGNDNIKTVESSCSVAVTVGSDEEEGATFIDFTSVKTNQTSKSGLNIHASGIAFDDRMVYTVEGDMSQIEVNVIVNSADNGLSLLGGLGKVLANKGKLFTHVEAKQDLCLINYF